MAMLLMCDAHAEGTVRERQRFVFALCLNLFAFSMLWRSIYIFNFHPALAYVYSDMQAYVDMAKRILEPTYQYGAGDAFHPVGTSLMLAGSFLIDSTFRYASLAQFGMSCLVPLLIAAIGYELFGRRVALVGLAISSGYFQFVDYASYFLSENPFLFFMMLSFWLLIRSLRVRRARWVPLLALFAGVALGAAATFKSVGLAAAGLVGLFLLYLGIRYRWARVGMVLSCGLVGMLLIVVPVSARAMRINEGQFCVVSANGPMNVLLGHYGEISSIHFNDKKRYCFYDFGTAAMVQQNLMAYKDVDFGPCDGKECFQAAWEWTKANPIESFLLSIHHVFNLFNTTPWPTSATKDRRWIRFAEQLYIVFIFIPALFYLLNHARGILRRDKDMFGDILVLLPLVALVVVAFFTIGEPRYRIPFDGFTILLAARFYAGPSTRADGLVPPVLAVPPVSSVSATSGATV
ncbi:MAG: glycosyltransferase family 39 protein [Planctomycetota bacterium]